jgi:hypothetical protein
VEAAVDGEKGGVAGGSEGRLGMGWADLRRETARVAGAEGRVGSYLFAARIISTVSIRWTVGNGWAVQTEP